MSLVVYPVVKSMIAKMVYKNGFSSYYHLCKALGVEEDVFPRVNDFFESSTAHEFHQDLIKITKSKNPFFLQGESFHRLVMDEIKYTPENPYRYRFLDVFEFYWQGVIEWRRENGRRV